MPSAWASSIPVPLVFLGALALIGCSHSASNTQKKTALDTALHDGVITKQEYDVKLAQLGSGSSGLDPKKKASLDRLLKDGVLTQDEYDAKVRELTAPAASASNPEAQAAASQIIDTKVGKDTFSNDNGTLTIKSDFGTQRIGEGSKNILPAWVPAYPGATTTQSSVEPDYNHNPGHSMYSQGLETKDSLNSVADFYRSRLLAAGFKVTQTYHDNTSAVLTMENAEHKFSLTAGHFPGVPTTNITVTAEDN